MRDTDKEENGTPKWGRLLFVLAFALVLVVALTFGSEAYFR